MYHTFFEKTRPNFNIFPLLCKIYVIFPLCPLLSGDFCRIRANYVVTDTYTAYYSYNNLTVVDTYDPAVFARDLPADYVTDGGLA